MKAKIALITGKNAPISKFMEPIALSFTNDNKKKKPTINTLNKALRLANLY